MANLIGIDIGTSGTKTILISQRGRVLASKTVEYPLLTPKPGWAEQDPEAWWKATQASCRAVMRASGVAKDSIAGISFSGQMHGSVFLDKHGEVIRPCLLWCDGRTVAECDDITKTIGAKQLHKMVSNPALTGFTLPKILWLRNNEKGNYKRTRQILLPKDYVRYRMTGEYATEISDAAGTLMVNVKKRKWCKKLLSKLEVPTEWLPKIYNSYDVCGHLTAEAATACGLAEGTPVIGGAADQPAGSHWHGHRHRRPYECQPGHERCCFCQLKQIHCRS